MLAFAVAHHIATNVAALTFTPTATGGNVFVDWMPDQPDMAVAVMSQPGRPQRSKLPHDLPGIQLLVRGTKDTLRTTVELADDLYSLFAGMGRQVLAADTADEVIVVGCTAAQSSPVPLGRDDKGRPEYSLNLEFHIHNPTLHRPAVNA